jgi:PAS domain S-box-containing protein
MDEQVVASHIAQIIGTLAAGFVFLAKYREVLGFIWQLFLLAAKPFQCFWRWIKLARKLESAQEKNENRFDSLEKSIKDLTLFVKEKLSPNGGSSPVDAIKRIENRQIASDARQAALLNDANDGIFYCDVNGRNSWVNRTYARFLGCGTNELLGLGWKKFIHTDELKRYHQVWSEAFADGCEFEDFVTFYDVENKPIKLKIAANAIQNEKGETVSYIGQVIKV